MIYTVPMVVKVLKVLSVFRQAGPRLALTQVISLCGIPKASAFRILETLRSEGYLTRDTHGSYRLTYQLLEVAMVVHTRNPLRRAALPYLEQLNREVKETVNLGVLEETNVVYAEVLESQHWLRIVPSVGTRVPLHATALGKAVAAYLSREELTSVLGKGGLKSFTPNTITTMKTYLQELAKTQERGYGVDHEEEALQCICVAAPVFDSRSRIAGAISVSVPSSRMPARRIHELGVRLKEVARAVSDEFGFTRETRFSSSH